MRIHDITRVLQPTMPIYPGDAPFERTETRSLDRGDTVTLSRLTLGSHTGTHVDAPSHFIPGGPTLDQMPLETFMGPARVVDATAADHFVDASEVRTQRPRRGEILLFQTRNSERAHGNPEFFKDFVALSPEAASALVKAGVKAVGVDYLSVEAFGSIDATVHRTLLAKPVGIIEGLDLWGVAPGRYRLFCLPLRVQGTEGAPARAVLVGP